MRPAPRSPWCRSMATRRVRLRRPCDRQCRLMATRRVRLRRPCDRQLGSCHVRSPGRAGTGEARAHHAAQSHHQIRDLRGPHARRAGQRRPDRIPPVAGRRRSRHDHGGLLRGLPRRPHRRQRDLDAPGSRARFPAAHRRDPRRGRGGLRPDRTCGSGRQRPLQQGHGAGAGAVLQPDRHAVRQEGQPPRHRRRDRRARQRGPAGRRRRIRRRRSAFGPQLSGERVSEPADQPPQRRVRRLAGEPGQGRSRDGAGRQDAPSGIRSR